MNDKINKNIEIQREEEKPLIELPALIKIVIIFAALCLGLSLLVLPWFIPPILFISLCFFLGIIVDPFIGIILFLLSAYFHPLALASAQLVQYQPATIAAFFIFFAWGFHIIVFRDFKLPKTSQLMYWFGFLAISLATAFLHWEDSRYFFLELLKVLMLYFLIINLVKTKSHFLTVIYLILALTFISAVFGIFQQIRGIGEVVSASDEMVRAGSFENNPNYFAMNLVLLVPLVVAFIQNRRNWIWKGVFLFLLSVFLISIIFTFSRAGLLGLSVVLVLSAWKFFGKQKRVLSVFVMIAIFLTAILFVPESYIERIKTISNLQEFSIKGRIDGFLVGSEIMLQHPILGVGMGRWRYEYWPIAFSMPDIKTKVSTTPHNVFIETGAEIGIIALIFFLLLLLGAFRDLRKARNTFLNMDVPAFVIITDSLSIGLVGFLFCALFAAAIYLKIFWIILGLTVVLKNLAYETEKNRPIDEKD